VSAALRLRGPLERATVERMRLGDTVWIDGPIVLVGGLPTHERLRALARENQPAPFDLRGAVVLHFGSYSHEEDGELRVDYMNPTTSTRFNDYMPELIRHWRFGVVGGKGGLDAGCAAAMRACGCAYLSFPGGFATLYTRAIRAVQAVEWRDLIFHYRLVRLEVADLGPATVAIDAHGGSLYESIAREAPGRMRSALEVARATPDEPPPRAAGR